MTKEQYELLHTTLKDVIKTDPGEIGADVNLIEVGILDSLDAMNFLFQLQKKSNASFGDIEDFDFDSLSFGHLATVLP